MKPNDEIRRVAVVGTGLIGAGWAAHFLAQGLEVMATDPAPAAEEELRRRVDYAWPMLAQLGLHPLASRERLYFTSDLQEAVRGADFVQESGPERENLKKDLFATLDGLLPPHVILASSSSGLLMSAIQSGCRHPGRCVIGHPFNPPYLMPLVEVVGGAATSPETIARTIRFYTEVKKSPIHLRKEARGHVANRLQAALWREAVHLVAEGVASVADVDAAVRLGPGLRWGVMGPHLTFHLAGGNGGMHHFMEHLSGPVATWWADLGQPVLTPQLKALLVEGVADEAAGRSVAELERERDQGLLSLLAASKPAPERR